MKKLLYTLTTLLLLAIPTVSYSATAVPMIATSTNSTFVFPQWGGTINQPAVMAPFFFASSTTATSTFRGVVNIGTSTAETTFTQHDQFNWCGDLIMTHTNLGGTSLCSF